ncbi:MAG: HK97 gp10 family phage protein [Clostridia bacterium]|nr:HK97 gp10 family phage protein [Clostridia bacterium]
MSESITVDSRAFIRDLNRLSSRNHKKAIKKSLTEGAKVTVKEARRGLRMAVGKTAFKKSKKTGKSIASGIKYTAQRNILEDGVKVHIMKDFRLKFYEKGTVDRHTKKGYNRGKIAKTNFFTNSLSRCEEQAFRKVQETFRNEVLRGNRR